MKIVSSSYKPYTLKLKRPFLTSTGRILERKGFLIKFKSENGKTGYGDCCPLPEFGSESYEQAESVLQNLQLKVIIDFDNIEKSILKTVEPLTDFPSLKHGFEQSILNLVAREKNLSLNELLNASSQKAIKVNGVIGLLPINESVNHALKLVFEGYKTIKLKIGRKNFDEDLDCLKAIRKNIANNINLRIDVNGKWDLKNAVSQITKLESFNIEFIEQPVNKIEDYLRLKNITKVPLAADESIRSLQNAYDLISKKAVSVIILKPMMLGGIIPTLKIIEFAQDNNIKVAITTSLDSVIGRSFAVLAASFVKQEIAHGLGTAELFENDLFEDPYKIFNGQINLTN